MFCILLAQGDDDMRTDRVTFLHPARSATGETLTCRETGIRYSLTRIELLGYTVTSGDALLGFRDDRASALDLIEQQAALDFVSAQSDSAFAA
jgi:hypothetical protein